MDMYNPFKPVPPPESGQAEIATYLSLEDGFVSAKGYKDMEENLYLRQYVLKLLQIHSKQLPVEPEEFDAFTPYLALNYFDNFISRNKIRKGMGMNSVDLLATCCLLKAGKTMNPYLSDDQFMERIRQGGLHFKQRKIAKMEQKIKDAFMLIFPITAFGFLECFFSKFPSCFYHTANINQLIIQSHADIYLAELKPSVIAASALLVGVREHLGAAEHDVIRNTFIRDFQMKEEQLDLCSAKMKEHCDKRQIPIEVVCWDSTRAPVSAQPYSSQVIVGKEKQKLKRKEVADWVQEFGFAINWVDDSEKVAFESILKRGFFYLTRGWHKWYTKKTTVPDQ